LCCQFLWNGKNRISLLILLPVQISFTEFGCEAQYVV